MDDELIRLDAAALLNLLDDEWREGAEGVDVFVAAHLVRLGQQAGDGRLPKNMERFGAMLERAAGGVDALLWRMVQDRERVEKRDPWLFGAVLFWLDQRVDCGGTLVQRFLVFQRAGFWPHQTFKAWASEATGVAEKTWWAWQHNVAVLLSPEGQEAARMAGFESAAEFADAVPIGKMTRAAGTIATGGLRPHQAEALADDEVTEARMTHALRMSAADWHDAQAEREREAREWVERRGPRHWLERDETGGVLRLRSVDGDGLPSEALVARFPAPSTPLVARVQRAMIEAAEREVKAVGAGSGEDLAKEFAAAMVGESSGG